MRIRPFISVLAAASLLVATALTGCRLIDEDISKCNNQVRLTYQLELDPEIIQELEDELDLHADEDIRAMLKGYIDGIFTNYARDVDLFFYDVDEPMDCLRTMSETMNSATNTYAISMPVRSYQHIALANVKVSENVAITGEGNYPTLHLEHNQENGVYAPQKSGLFTVHKRLDVGEKPNQRFRIKLGMANSATALILDTGKATHVTGLRVEVNGMSTAFNVADSVYVYDDTAVFSTEEFSTGYKHCFASVHFPSHDAVGYEDTDDTKATEYDDDDDNTERKTWRWYVYATLDDGSVTRSTLEMRPAVKAGQLKIRNAFVKEDGEVGSNEVDVSVTVKLDWKPGLDIDVPL